MSLRLSLKGRNSAPPAVPYRDVGHGPATEQVIENMGRRAIDDET